MQAKTFFNPEQKTTITRTIAGVEARTSGELAVMVVDQSDTYPESRILCGILFGGILALVITDLWFSASLWTFLPLFISLALLIGWTVDSLPGVKRFFIPSTRRESMVREEAIQAFYKKGLHNTRDSSGVLFFISLFEHRVWVLADKGIYEKISQKTLQEYAADIASGIKKGQATEALCKAINKVGILLADHFPTRPDDTNELPYEVLLA